MTKMAAKMDNVQEKISGLERNQKQLQESLETHITNLQTNMQTLQTNVKDILKKFSE